MPTRRRSTLDQRGRRALTDEDRRADILEGEAREARTSARGAIEGFDPRRSSREVGGALMSDLEEMFSRGRTSRARGANARGLGTSPIGTGRLHRNVARAGSDAFARLGNETARLELGRANSLAGLYGVDVGRAESGRNRYLDFLSGERDRETNEENARRIAEAQERPWWQDVLGIAAEGVGSYLGGR